MPSTAGPTARAWATAVATSGVSRASRILAGMAGSIAEGGERRDTGRALSSAAAAGRLLQRPGRRPGSPGARPGGAHARRSDGPGRGRFGQLPGAAPGLGAGEPDGGRPGEEADQQRQEQGQEGRHGGHPGKRPEAHLQRATVVDGEDHQDDRQRHGEDVGEAAHRGGGAPVGKDDGPARARAEAANPGRELVEGWRPIQAPRGTGGWCWKASPGRRSAARAAACRS